MFFAADAQYRAAGSAYEAENYGEWVARLRYADSQLKQIAAKGNAIDVRVSLILFLQCFFEFINVGGHCRFLRSKLRRISKKLRRKMLASTSKLCRPLKRLIVQPGI